MESITQPVTQPALGQEWINIEVSKNISFTDKVLHNKDIFGSFKSSLKP